MLLEKLSGRSLSKPWRKSRIQSRITGKNFGKCTLIRWITSRKLAQMAIADQRYTPIHVSQAPSARKFQILLSHSLDPLFVSAGRRIVASPNVQVLNADHKLQWMAMESRLRFQGILFKRSFISNVSINRSFKTTLAVCTQSNNSKLGFQFSDERTSVTTGASTAVLSSIWGTEDETRTTPQAWGFHIRKFKAMHFDTSNILDVWGPSQCGVSKKKPRWWVMGVNQQMCFDKPFGWHQNYPVAFCREYR